MSLIQNLARWLHRLWHTELSEIVCTSFGGNSHVSLPAAILGTADHAFAEFSVRWPTLSLRWNRRACVRILPEAFQQEPGLASSRFEDRLILGDEVRNPGPEFHVEHSFRGQISEVRVRLNPSSIKTRQALSLEISDHKSTKRLAVITLKVLDESCIQRRLIESLEADM